LQSFFVKTTDYFKVIAAVLLSGVHIYSYAVDSASLEFATGNFTQVTRLGAQWDWKQKWWENGDSFLGGYWDLSAAAWHGSHYRNILRNTQNLGDLGITPVFRLQKNGGIGSYFEAAIGTHLLTALYDNNGRELSTKFEFGDSLGVGYQFSSGWDIGLKIQHFSNGGIEHPNSGVNFAVARIGKRF
jgi:hypothetical protein